MTALRTRTLLLCAAILLAAAPARATSIDDLLEGARTRHERLVLEARRARARLDRLQARFDARSAEAGRAAMDAFLALRSQQEAEEALDRARAEVAARVRSAYEVGPAAHLEAFLGAGSLADLAAMSMYADATMELQAASLRRAESAAEALDAGSASALAAQQVLIERRARLLPLLDRLRAAYEEAARLAGRAGLRVDALERRRLALEEAAQQQIGWDVLTAGGTGTDQSALLALLGPTGGRTCDIPPGLRDTGKSFSGLASWYGWEFAGQPTATGAIFDPRLFTVANRWLPFGTFLRVRYGGRCAIVLVNDRGPYGDLRRVIDLAWAPADYLGVGVSPITADILVPA